jgi:hypothetical protein
MKSMKKVKLVCTLKSGAVIKESLKVDERAMMAIFQMKTALENSVGYKELKLQNITFGHTTISVAEIAAIKMYN